MVLENFIIKFTFVLKMMSKNTFPEPQPHSASYFIILVLARKVHIFVTNTQKPNLFTRLFVLLYKTV